MPELDRRHFLSYLGIGTALTTQGAASSLFATSGPRLEEIAAKLIACSREAALDVAVGLLAKGATWRDLLGVFMPLKTRPG